ncbi:MAG TPA: ABC transporter permease, partial [Candidatus Polarisedimenticolaceae bacterium]|nr:ABC transporter permease [Candidatus Polarisedimenticolaceae bacterium]
LDDSKLIPPEALTGIQAKAAATKEAGIRQAREGRVDAFVYYPADPSKQPIEIFAKDVGLTKNDRYSAVAEQLLKSSVVDEVGSKQKVAIIQGAVHSNVTTYANGHESDRAKRMIAPGALLVLLYLVIILLGNQMLASTTEEKENRVIEMILTAVRARTLIIGKIIALVMLGTLQIIVIVLPIVAAFVFFGKQLKLPVINLSQLQIDPLQMLIGVILFVCSFLLFTGLLVAIGAAVPTAKEASNFFGITIFSMFVPLYAIFPIISNPDQLIVKFFSFFPLTAPVTLLLRNAVGNLSGAETVAGIGVLVVSSILALAIATRAFSYGSLEYNRKLSLRELWPR